MKMNRPLLLLTLLVVGLASCKKDKDSSTPPKVTTGVLVLNEGNYGFNNTTLTWYNAATATPNTDFYANANGSGLGDTGNDMLVYGSKLYIVMNVSNYVEVADAKTGKTIKKIPFKIDATTGRLPRQIIAWQNKVFVSSWDNTVAVIDTTSLNVEKFIGVGSNPEGMAVVGDKLYVCNSGALSLVAPDSTISVVSLSALTQITTIKVGVNPTQMVADASGNLYVGCAGDYDQILPKLVKVNAVSGTVVKSADTATGKIRFYNGSLYASGGYSGVPFVRKLSTTDFSQQSANFVTDGTSIMTPYGLNIDPDNGDVYITDAKHYVSSGEVFCFDKDGKKKFSFSVSPGVSPSTVVMIKE